MSKRLKKAASTIASAAVCTASLLSINSSALLQEDYLAGTLGNVVDSFGKGAIAEYYNTEYNYSALVITGDFNGYYFTEYYKGSQIIIKEGETLPVDEINEKISPNTIISDSDGNYTVSASKISDRENIYDIITEYEAVASINENFEVCKTRDDLWTVEGVYINSDLSPEEIIESYSELDLVYMTDASVNNDYDYYFALTAPFGNEACNENYYNGIKKLFDNDVDHLLDVIIAAGTEEDYKSGTVNVYSAESDTETTTTTTTEATVTTTVTTTAPAETTTVPEAATTAPTEGTTDSPANATTAASVSTTKAASTSTSASKGTNSPKTGDNGIAAAAVAGLTAIASAFVLRKHDN